MERPLGDDAPARVCVVGAGPAGLAAARALTLAGVGFDCFDGRDRVGGIWAHDPEPGRTSAWQSLTLNSPRGWYEFTDHPMPRTYPDFPLADQVWTYLDGCLDRYAMRHRFRLGTAVETVAKVADGWEITTDDGVRRAYDAVVVANGHHNEPLLPDFPGTFAGRVLHSRDYRSREEFRGRRVLVVGFGNSGSQIAVDVSHAAAGTELAIRRGGYVLPHYLHRVRIDRVLQARLNLVINRFLPHWLASRVMTATYRLLVGRPDRSGLPKPDHPFGAALPTVSEDLHDRIEGGHIRVRPNIARLDGDAVEFTDGSRTEVDDLILCTGYTTTTPFLDERVLRVVDNDVPLFKRVFHPDHDGLYFVGLLQAVGWGFLPLFEAQARLVAAHLTGDYRLPGADAMRADIARDRTRVRRHFVDSSRNRYQMNAEVYRHECGAELRAGEKRVSPPRR